MGASLAVLADLAGVVASARLTRGFDSVQFPAAAEVLGRSLKCVSLRRTQPGIKTQHLSVTHKVPGVELEGAFIQLTRYLMCK